MASLQEHESTMTLFYSRTTGNIAVVVGGIQTMEYFGEAKDDYNYDILYISHMDEMYLNHGLYKVEDGKVVLKSSVVNIEIKEV